MRVTCDVEYNGVEYNMKDDRKPASEPDIQLKE